MKFVWQIAYHHVNGACLGDNLVPKMLLQPKTWLFYEYIAVFDVKTVKTG